MKKIAIFVLLLFLLANTPVESGEADVEFVKLIKTETKSWDIYVTVKHTDEGFEHYADWWRILSLKKKKKRRKVKLKELARRVLLHPHEEQPFTRELLDVVIPKKVKKIVIQAHDNVHGYGGKKAKINLKKTKGRRFEIIR